MLDTAMLSHVPLFPANRTMMDVVLCVTSGLQALLSHVTYSKHWRKQMTTSEKLGFPT